MTEASFNLLELSQKSALTTRSGSRLAVKTFENYKVVLFGLKDFFAEVYYCIKTGCEVLIITWNENEIRLRYEDCIGSKHEEYSQGTGENCIPREKNLQSARHFSDRRHKFNRGADNHWVGFMV